MQNTSSAAELWVVHYLTPGGFSGVEITSDVPSTVARLESMDFIITDIVDGG
jgi:hypothetical protein